MSKLNKLIAAEAKYKANPTKENEEALYIIEEAFHGAEIDCEFAAANEIDA